MRYRSAISARLRWHGRSPSWLMTGDACRTPSQFGRSPGRCQPSPGPSSVCGSLLWAVVCSPLLNRCVSGLLMGITRSEDGDRGRCHQGVESAESDTRVTQLIRNSPANPHGRRWTHTASCGRIPAGESQIPSIAVGLPRTLTNPRRWVESTSQAEYAGSIPVIGSPLTRANAAECRFCQRPGTYPIPTVSIRDHGLRWLPPAKVQSADPRDVTILT
jgi:hypothetical protein